MPEDHGLDDIPLGDKLLFEGPDERGVSTALFYSCNTIITVRAVGASRRRFESAAYASVAAFRRWERLFSRMLPHSDVSRLNRAGGRTVSIAPETAELIKVAQSYCASSEGAFDITIGAVSSLWDFHRGIVPDRGQLAETAQHVDWRKVKVTENGKARQAQLLDPRAMLDLGGIAKGWMADRACELLQEQGLENVAVSLGGNVAARGRGLDGRGWHVAIRDPAPGLESEFAPAGRKGGDSPVSAGSMGIWLRDASAVTSGTYERAFLRKGVLYHHILDPRTGMPAATDAVSATLVCRRSLDAEGFSTAVLALGMQKGAALARTRPEIEGAFLIGRDESITCV